MPPRAPTPPALRGQRGGAVPVIKVLRESLAAAEIQRVIGIVNGTTNYMLTPMTDTGADYDDVLTKAQRLGFAEADPTADVDGRTPPPRWPSSPASPSTAASRWPTSSTRASPPSRGPTSSTPSPSAM